MSFEDADTALQIVEAGRQRVLARLREAVADQMRLHGGLDELDPATLDELLAQGVADAGPSLWRISLAEGAADHFGISVTDALRLPVIVTAEQLIGLPATQEDPADAPLETWSPTEDDPWATSEPGDAAETIWPQPGSVPAAAAVAETSWAQPEPEPELAVAPVAETTWARPEPAAAPTAAPETMWPEPEPITAAQPVVPEPAPQPVAAEPAPVAAEPEPVPTPVASTPSPAALAVPQALRIVAIHTTGIESLQAGDEDIELRLSEVGLDVIKRSSGIAIGRLDWGSITALEVQEPGKRGRRRRKSKNRSLQVDTGGGQAAFELVGLSDEETAEHLEPLLARLRASGVLASPS